MVDGASAGRPTLIVVQRTRTLSSRGSDPGQGELQASGPAEPDPAGAPSEGLRAPESPSLVDAEPGGRPERRDREHVQLEGEAATRPRHPDDPVRYEQQFAQATQIPTATPAAIPAPVAIGKVDKVSGIATATRNGVQVELHLGDPIYRGDVLETASGAALTVRFSDGTVFGLSTSARIVVNDMFYASGGTGANNAFFSILKGAVGLVAGRAAKTGDFSVDTPVGTMGIRGTAVKIDVAADGTTKFSVMREPNGAVGRVLIFDKADHSHVLATLQDVRTAVLFPGLGAADPSPIRITKTNDDLRSEGALVRDLFQSLRDLFPRRGSADPDFGPVVPAGFDLGPFGPDVPHTAAFGPIAFGAALTPVETVTPTGSSERRTISAQATTFEDGPQIDLGDATTELFLITPPAVLPAGVSFDAKTGRFELNPSNIAFQSLGAGQTKTVVVHYMAFDGVATFPATVTWIVEGINDAPVAKADRIAGIAEDGTAVLDVTANDSDVEGDALTIAQLSQPAEGRVFVDAGGHLVFDPGTAFDGLREGDTATVSFTYTVSDGHGGTATEVATLTVEGRNDAPVAKADLIAGIAEDGTAVLDVITNDSDVEGDALTLAQFSQPAEGRVFVDAGGHLVFDPGTDFNDLGEGRTATVSFTYTVSDGHGGTATEVATLTVEGRNDAPVAAADSIVGVADDRPTVLDVTANDSDVDGGDVLTIAQFSQPTEGRVFVDADGHLVFDPGTAFASLGEGRTATVSFTYTVSDGHGGTATEVATLSVKGEGTFVSPSVSVTQPGVLPESGQSVQFSLTAPAQTVETTAELNLAVTLGAVPPHPLNILYVVDVSGSTSNRFDGAAVGDRNGDGIANTILDAEIASLSNLTERVKALGFSPDDVSITLVPFNGAAGPPQTFALSDAGIAEALSNLASGGDTNFEAALQAAAGRLEFLDPGHNERNVLYFLSDGNADSSVSDELATLENELHTTISAVGVGSPVRLDLLDAIDNTGGAIALRNQGGLEIGPVGEPVQSGDVTDVDVFINGLLLADVGIEDLVPSADGFRLSVPAANLQPFTGDHNSIVATITLTGGVTLTASLDVQGALPRSTDFDF